MATSSDARLARSLLASARERLQAQQLDVAGRLAERARDVFVDAGDLQSACAAARMAAVARARRSDVGGARELYEWIAEEAEPAAMHGWAATARTELGSIAETLGDLHGALDQHERAAVAAGQAHRADLVAMARGNLGRIRQRFGDLDQAHDDYEAAHQGFLAAGSPLGAINALICIGDLYRQRARLDEAARIFAEAFAAAEREGQPRLAALAALNSGHAARDLGERDRATTMFDRTLEIGAELQDPQLIGGGRLGFGLMLAESGPAEEALAHFEAAEAAFQAAGTLPNAIACAVNAASIQCRLGHLEAGRSRMEQAYKLLQAVGDARGAAEVHLALAEVMTARGDVKGVRAMLETVDVAPHGPRLVRRAAWLRTRIALHGLSLAEARVALAEATALGEERTATEQFAMDLAQLEMSVLAGERGVLDRAMTLRHGDGKALGPREDAAATAIAGWVATWVGALDLGAELLTEAVALWGQLGEPIAIAAAEDMRARVTLLSRTPVNVAALRERAVQMRTAGATDVADSLEITALVGACVAEAPPGETPSAVARKLRQALRMRIAQGRLQGAWQDACLAAAVLDDVRWLREATSLEAGQRLCRPAWTAASAQRPG